MVLVGAGEAEEFLGGGLDLPEGFLDAEKVGFFVCGGGREHGVVVLWRRWGAEGKWEY